MYKILLESHSGFRYIVFLLLVIALLIAFTGWLAKSAYGENNRKLNLFAMISVHIQLLLGVVLYFISPFVQFSKEAMKDAMLRYWTAEHSVMMLIAIVLITIGHSRSKKMTTAVAKHRNVAIFYGLAVIIIVEAIVMSQRPLVG